ncbi:MAG: MFS transporter [Telmatospirillum sp.]|nr:MFS transporter [Telmatospirillum sp.]
MPRRAFAVAAIALGITMAVLDGAIANVALPVIARQLQVDNVASIWVINAYQLTIVLCLLPFAALGDILGYRRVYIGGLTVFTLASLACALSSTLPALVATRVLQGLGAAGMMSVNTALVRFIYPRRLIGQGVGINAMVVAVSAVLGPSIATAILAAGSWPWLFAVNLPVGVAALAVSRHLPVTEGSGRSFDVIGALLNGVTFGLLITAIDGLAHGGAETVVVLQAAIAIGVGIVLVRRQARHPAPLLPVDLLLRPIFALSIAASICAFSAQMLAFVSLPFHLQGELHRSQLETGLLMTPWPLAVAVVAPIAGRLSDRYPPSILGAIGLVTFAGGLTLLASLSDAPANLDIAWRMAVCGLGFALFQAPNNRTIISSAPVARSGGASGMLGMARLLGQSTGAALVALALGRFPAMGTAVSLWTGTGFALAAALFSGLRPPRTV